MSSADQNKPGGKSGRRNRKAEQQRSQKPDQQQSAKPDLQQQAKQLIDAAVASTDTSQVGPQVCPQVGHQVGHQVDSVAAADTPSVGAVAATDTSPIGLQTIATAYSDYTRKSFEEARSYLEKLSGVRSLDKALEIQAEFAKQACETFAADSQKIRELYSELARQTFKPSKSTPAAR